MKPQNSSFLYFDTGSNRTPEHLPLRPPSTRHPPLRRHSRLPRTDMTSARLRHIMLKFQASGDESGGDESWTSRDESPGFGSGSARVRRDDEVEVRRM